MLRLRLKLRLRLRLTEQHLETERVFVLVHLLPVVLLDGETTVAIEGQHVDLFLLAAVLLFFAGFSFVWLN